MYIKNQRKLINISIYVGTLITIVYLFSGLAFDSLNYLSQSEPGGNPGAWAYFTNKNSILDRTNITFLIIYPFSLFGIYIGGILYILMTTYLLRITYRFIYSLRNKNSKSEFKDVILIYPYYIAYILILYLLYIFI